MADDPRFYVPEVIDEFSTKSVLTTELVSGEPLDKCLELDQDVRNEVSTPATSVTNSSLVGQIHNKSEFATQVSGKFRRNIRS